ncbi:flagellar biosynthetic protein FliR [Ketobacter sp.]|uniref:flagellar biosynthetic protein FliR n=1 Tax=Ketobacter sp. TaxID=2083498 RepID=UPI000F192F5C|nr:flagellar biosynthetic protein FliR [Ketobacter sp.]RLU00514.1 MAG: flagellar type III secretion system protein FliR [Ketobacter sp.]
MFEIGIEQLYQWIGQYAWPFCRIAAFFMAMPILSTQLVPARIRLGLAAGVTLVVAPMIDPVPMIELLSIESFLIILQQILIGVAMGFVLQLMFQVFVVGGQIVAMQNGLGFALMVDPVNGVSVAAISQLYLMTVNLLFFALNGHLAVMYLIGTSFEQLPIGQLGLPVDNYLEIARLGSWMFTGAVLVALPSIIALLVVNVSFGVISRVAPQMNIIAVGFPFTMVMGLIIIWLTLSNILPQYEHLSADAFDFLRQMVQ